MDPIQYKQDSRLIRWAYLFEEVRPLKTSTCALFWRAAVLSPLKVLGPTLLTAAAVAVLGTVALSFVAPQLLPMSMQPSDAPHAPMPREVKYGLAIVIALGPIIIFAEKLGFFTWLHGFCYPVEIEGGLVKRGSCPRLACTGFMIDRGDGAWECRRCHGTFTPPPPDESDDDDDAEPETEAHS